MTFVSILVQDVAGPTGKVLICRREQNSPWELPAGKALTSETAERTVSRIAWEELGIDVNVGILQTRGRNKQPNALYNYHEYYSAVNAWGKEPKNSAYCDMKWVYPTELGEYEFAGDDKVFVNKYVAWLKGEEICYARMY